VVDRGSTTYGLNKAGFVLHSVIHKARPEVNAIIHIHTGLAAGLSVLKHGLLPISQEALICGNASYHDYGGILIDEGMKEKIRADLGPKNKILILRNHGVAVCGRTLEEAWFYLFNFMFAADIQFHALAAASNGIHDLHVPPPHVLDQVQRIVNGMTGADGGGVNEKSADGIQWRLGEMEFEAEMRSLDRLVSLRFFLEQNFKLNLQTFKNL
jgi:adducin